MFESEIKDLWIIWWIILDNPVNFWNIETTSGNIGAEQDCFLGIAEMEECLCSFILLLLALTTIRLVNNYH